MCYYKRTRYSCNHSRFTLLLRPCHVQVEHQADPEGCAPCDVKDPHPMHTVSVRAECIECRRMVGTVRELKAALGAIRGKVEELEQARDLARGRLQKRLSETSEEGAGLDACEERALSVKEEKIGVLELAKDMARERLETRLREAREKGSDVVGCASPAVGVEVEGEEGESEVGGNVNTPGEESGGVSPRTLLPNVRSSW